MTEKTKKTETTPEIRKFGDKGATVNVTLKLSDVQQFYATMKGLNGILDNKKAISWGRDLRVIKPVTEEIKDFPETIKNDDLVKLEKEFSDLQQASGGKKSNYEIIQAWPKGEKYLLSVADFNKRYNVYLNEKVEFFFQTQFAEKDIHKVESGEMAEMLSWFWKEELK